MQLVLVRHAEVNADFREICYGQSDVPLSERGHADSLVAAKELAVRYRPSLIYHSGLSRTRSLADAIGDQLAGETTLVEDQRLLELNYGDWQGKRWDEIYRHDPDFHNLIIHPTTYGPPRGETVSAMQLRVVTWYQSLRLQPLVTTSCILAIAHSGPIAALAGHLLELAPTEWGPWTIKCLEAVEVPPNGKDLKRIALPIGCR